MSVVQIRTPFVQQKNKPILQYNYQHYNNIGRHICSHRYNNLGTPCSMSVPNYSMKQLPHYLPLREQ